MLLARFSEIRASSRLPSGPDLGGSFLAIAMVEPPPEPGSIVNRSIIRCAANPGCHKFRRAVLAVDHRLQVLEPGPALADDDHE